MNGRLKEKGAACMRNTGLQLGFEAKLLMNWLYDHRWKWIASACVFFVMYATWMFGVNVRVDSEGLLNHPYTTAGWLGIGRQGGILTEYVFGLRWFNPLLCSALGYAAFFFSGLLIAYLFVRIGDIGNYAAMMFILLYQSSPIFTEVLYFDMMIFKVAFAGMLCALAVGLDFYGIIEKNWLLRLAAGLAMIWTFSTYQAFVPLYIGITAACYVLMCKKTGVADSAFLRRLLAELIVDFVVFFLINSAITKAFFSSGSYFNLQNMWLSLPFWLCMRHIAGHIVRGVFGLKDFYSIFYAVFAACSIVLAFMEGRKSTEKKSDRWLYALLLACIQMIPFMMTVVLGGEPGIRTQMVYPLILAFDMLFCLNMTAEKRKLRVLVCLLAVIAAFSQVKTTMRFVYTESIRAQQDTLLTWEVFSRIGEETDGDKPLMFVGERECDLNGACLRGEVIGGSFYKWDAGIAPRYTRSSMRITDLARTQGFDYKWVSSKEDAEHARRLAADMPVYPREGCILETDRFIVVKMAEDPWYSELN